MLKRILSPRQPPGPRNERSQSSSAIQFSANGHGRHGSDESEDIKNPGYGNPDNFNPPVRSQSMVTKDNPPLPPRNARPAFSIGPQKPAGEGDPESALYVAPVDTLRKPVANSSGVSPSVGSENSLNVVETVSPGDAQPTRNERKVLELHRLTMLQRKGQGGGGTAPPASTGNNGTPRSAAEDSEYSIPFNLENKPTRPPSRPGRGGNVISQARHDPGDRVIPINPPSTSPHPPSDRSDTNSPSSPMSNQSSEHDTRPSESDYAIPWDSNKYMPHRNPRKPQGKRRPDDSGYGEDSSSSSVQRSEQRAHGMSVSERSPPPPARSGFRYQSAREPVISHGPMVVEYPIPPELPFDSRPHRGRAVSERVARSNGSTSPVGVGVGGMGRIRGERDEFVFHSQTVTHHHNPPRPELQRERDRLDTYPLPPPPPSFLPFHIFRLIALVDDTIKKFWYVHISKSSLFK